MLVKISLSTLLKISIARILYYKYRILLLKQQAFEDINLASANLLFLTYFLQEHGCYQILIFLEI